MKVEEVMKIIRKGFRVIPLQSEGSVERGISHNKLPLSCRGTTAAITTEQEAKKIW